MDSTEPVPMDIDDHSNLSGDGVLMDVAGGIIQEYNLDPNSILALANALDQLEDKDHQDQLETKNRKDEPVAEDLEHEPEAKKAKSEPEMKARENESEMKACENEPVIKKHKDEPEIPKINDPQAMMTNWRTMLPVIKDDRKVKKNEPLVPFPQLATSMCNLANEVPGWLTSPSNRVQDFSDREFYILSVIAEVRYWIGEAKLSHEQLKTWQIVFGLPRNVHAQMMNKSDAAKMGKWLNIAGLPCSFAADMPQYFFEDMSDSYKQLRDTHFPNGIDDALPVYFKHMKEGEVAVAQLRRRVTWLAKRYPPIERMPLCKESSTLLFEMTKTLLTNYSMAEKWQNFTKSQKLYYQLPGVDLGLAYGEDVHTDLDVNKSWMVAYPEGKEKPVWLEANGHPLVRWQVGSPWLDFLRNVRQDHPALRTFDHRDMISQPVAYTAKNPGPIEVRMPPVLLKLIKHYVRDHFELMGVEDPPPSITDKEAQAVKKELAEKTGENWLIDERWTNETSTMLGIHFPAKAVFEGRPRHDAFGNLRCDYMNAILRELRIGKWTTRYKLEMRVAIKQGGCEENPDFGYDLLWEPPKPPVAEEVEDEDADAMDTAE